MNRAKFVEKLIRVLLVGMDPRKQAVFRMAFEMHGARRLEAVDDGEAELAIVDFDVPDAMSVWEGFRATHPDIPALIVTTVPPADPPAPVLLRPIRVEKLIPSLKQLLPSQPPASQADRPSKNEAAAPQGAAMQPSAPIPGSSATRQPVPASRATSAPSPPADQPTRHAWPERLERFDPRVGLLGALLEITRHQSPSVVSIAGSKALIVLPDQDRAVLLQPENALQDACAAPSVLVTSRPCEPDDSLDGKSMSHTALMWQVALWTSRGRLLEGFPERRPVRLRHWPNLTRLAPLPNGLRLAAFWTRTPATLQLTQKVLNVPVHEMFDFLASVHSIGILELPKAAAKPARASAGHAVETASRVQVANTPHVHPAQKRFGGVLSRLLRKVAGL